MLLIEVHGRTFSYQGGQARATATRDLTDLSLPGQLVVASVTTANRERVRMTASSAPFPLLLCPIRGNIRRVKGAYANIMLWECDLNVVFFENRVYFKPNR
jgi:hypothetical protein